MAEVLMKDWRFYLCFTLSMYFDLSFTFPAEMEVNLEDGEFGFWLVSIR